MGSKFHFSLWKTCLPQVIDKFLKFDEMEYLIHYVKFKMWPALFYLNFLSHFRMKLKLGQNFSLECYSYWTS